MIMKPEPYLNERGVEIFNRLVKHLKNQPLQDIDSFAVSTCAQMLSRYEYCAGMVNAGHDVEEAKSGWKQVSPYQKEMTDLQVKIPVYMKKLGLTPEDRANLKIQDKKKSKLDKI